MSDFALAEDLPVPNAIPSRECRGWEEGRHIGLPLRGVRGCEAGVVAGSDRGLGDAEG